MNRAGLAEGVARLERIVGSDAVRDAVQTGRPVVEIYIAREAPAAKGDVPELARAQGIPVRLVTERQLAEHAKGTSAEGVVAYVKSEGYAPLEDLLSDVEAGRKAPFLFATDLVDEAEVLGQLLRVVDAGGLAGLILPVRSIGITPAVVKASKGSVERVRVARVPNLAETLARLAARGFRVLGLDPDGTPMERVDFGSRTVVVLPPERHRLSAVVASACQERLRPAAVGLSTEMPLPVLAGQILYEWSRRRGAGDVVAGGRN